MTTPAHQPDALTAFVRARYDERERVARSAMRGPWHLGYIAADRAWQLSGTSDPHGIARIRDNGVNEGTLQHIVENDPAWVLADLESKRRILDLHTPHDRGACPTCWRMGNGSARREDYPCPTLRSLALPFAGHSDYREEWRP